jgi:hypothetical protein
LSFWASTETKNDRFASFPGALVQPQYHLQVKPSNLERNLVVDLCIAEAVWLGQALP